MFFFFDFCRKCFLIARRCPPHFRDITHRPQMIIRIAMAVQTPTHAKSLLLLNDFHLRNITVARFTSDTGVNMNAVIKIGVIGNLMHFDPFHRRIVRKTFPDQRKFFALRANQSMTVHARCCRRNHRHGRFFDAHMTVATVDSQIARVQFVTVGNRLFGAVPYVCKFGRCVIPKKSVQCSAQKKQSDQ